MKSIIIIAFASIFFSCHIPANENAIIVLKGVSKKQLVISSWQILGPFTSNQTTPLLETDNLKALGHPESEISFEEFCGILDETEGANNRSGVINQLVCLSRDGIVRLNELYNLETQNPVIKNSINANAYLGCILRSPAAQRLKLNFSSDDGGVMIWLNHRLIHFLDFFPLPLESYEQYIDLNLNKGDNFILIKVNNYKQTEWDIFAAIESESELGMRRHQVCFQNMFDQKFLNSSIINNNILQLNRYLSIPSKNPKIGFVDFKGDTLLDDHVESSATWHYNLRNFSTGMYKAFIDCGALKIEQYFYKGNIIDTCEAILTILKKRSLSLKIQKNIDALGFRLTHIMKPQYVPKKYIDSVNLQRKLISIFLQLEVIKERLDKGLDPICHVKGSFIRNYFSNIDSSYQYYVLHVPDGYSPDIPAGIVINIPTSVSKAPYLESFRSANVDLFYRLKYLSNKFNVLILEPHGRTSDQYNLNSIDENDYLEALESVKKDYSIDISRIYLTGFCQAGWGALKLAVKHPDIFAAIGLNSPYSTISHPNNYWLSVNDPVHGLKNLKNIPILMIHSELDMHTPVEVSDYLNEQVVKAGLKRFTYLRIPADSGYFYTHDERFEQLIDFLHTQKKNQSNDLYFTTNQLIYNKIAYITIHSLEASKWATISTIFKNNTLNVIRENISKYSVNTRILPLIHRKNFYVIDNLDTVYKGIPNKTGIFIDQSNNIEREHVQKSPSINGPLAHVFTDRFILVTQTINGVPQPFSNNVKETIQNLWTNQYFHKCLERKDNELSESDIKNSNLILSGHDYTTGILKRIYSQLPIKVFRDKIVIGKRVVMGNKLGFYIVYPNPLNKQKYVALIGTNFPEQSSIGYESREAMESQDISNYGWFDFKVWNADDPFDILLSGYFDQNWR